MIFGPQFYSRIKKLKNWQQLLFATVLAQRMLPNYEEYHLAQGSGTDQVDHLYQIVNQLWDYSEHTCVISDWKKIYSSLLPLIYNPEEASQISDFGVYSANCAVEGVLLAIRSILEHTGSESLKISELSVNMVISFLEQEQGHTIQDEEIVENEYVQNELDFQMEVAKTLNGHRSDAMFNKLKKLAYNEGYSNIGIKSKR